MAQCERYAGTLVPYGGTPTEAGRQGTRHLHTFEECYLIIHGEVETILDGERYVAKAGDVLWTSVGCVHSFANISDEPVIWLETMAPQPPRENAFRFLGEWETKVQELDG